MALIHLVYHFGPPPRWGRRGRGMLMSRRSVLLIGSSFFLVGLTTLAINFGIPWIERRVYPAVMVITLLAWGSAWLNDFDNDPDDNEPDD
jgi:hypothetical protein